MAEKKNLLVVCGPTASGKTKLAVQLAKRFDGEIVSADSMQVYRGMSIGTAKPTDKEKEGVPHHLLDLLNPDESFSVADFAAKARDAISGIQSRGRLPILAGGTGLYIQAVTDNIQFEEIAGDPAVREKFRKLGEELGHEELLARLRAVDPELAQRLHPNNTGRIIRGLEVYHLTGTPLSVLQRQSRRQPGEYRLLQLGLRFENREELYRRIHLRVEEMVEQGLVEEARLLKEQGYASTAGQAIGYKELFPYLDGEQTLEQALALLKMQTRRYAKRQITWFRRDPRIQWLTVDSATGREMLEQAAEIVERWL